MGKTIPSYTSRKPRFVLLQHDLLAPPGILGFFLEASGIYVECLHVERGDGLPPLTGYDAIIALGGPQHVYEKERYPYFCSEQALIRQAVEQEIPYLGICLGSQLLADALRGVARRQSVTEIGFFDVHLTEAGTNDPLYRGLPGCQTVWQWRTDSFDLPKGATLLASGAQTRNQAFRYGKRAYGLQYHPEGASSLLGRWLHNPTLKQEIETVLGSVQRLERQASRLMPAYRAESRKVIDNFFRLAGFSPACNTPSIQQEEALA